jgi:hypothetical protein
MDNKTIIITTIDYTKCELKERPKVRYGMDRIIIFKSDSDMMDFFFEQAQELDPDGLYEELSFDSILESLDIEYVLMTENEIDALPRFDP